MQTDILIVGGGISGLTAAWQLQNAGRKVCLIEARDHVGGRILTEGASSCDLGPSWFWPGQPLIASLLEKFGIPSFEQFAKGKVLWQDEQGQVQDYPMRSPMAGALRIQVGAGALTQRIAAEISAENLLRGHVLKGLQIQEDGVRAEVRSPEGELEILAKQLALAIPPRLAGAIAYRPELPDGTQQLLESTPTWMAGHAKFFALYDEPFWRELGLCGTAMSRQGPLAEIHDASPHGADGYSLFGFVGLDAKTRAQLGEAELIRMASEQLVKIYGEKAGHYKEVFIKDWSTESFTAGPRDQEPQRYHPRYGLNPALGEAWAERLKFISSESAFTNGGLIEGALEAGLVYAKEMIDAEVFSGEGERVPHTASMD
mgnify:CR=1 FL=1